MAGRVISKPVETLLAPSPRRPSSPWGLASDMECGPILGHVGSITWFPHHRPASFIIWCMPQVVNGTATPLRVWRPMIELSLGVVLLVAWGVLQFVVQPATGLIHVALAAGVILVVRGIARSKH